jgi:hypothetical protein
MPVTAVIGTEQPLGVNAAMRRQPNQRRHTVNPGAALLDTAAFPAT